jgi:hypothetical protein
VDDLLSQRKRLSAAHAEFEKTMSRAMILHRTPAPIAEIRERLEYACDRLNVVTDGIRNRGIERRSLGIPTIESMERRLEALETLAILTR